jgi:hypothetical protein
MRATLRKAAGGFMLKTNRRCAAHATRSSATATGSSTRSRSGDCAARRRSSSRRTATTFRVRLTHSLEVAQIGRASRAALGLNEDLTEALCLAHDLGHPPFGHAGEDALEAAMAQAGGFDHNAHTLRVLTWLETPYPRHAGYNLTWETLEGLAKHNGPIAEPTWAMAEADAAFPLGAWQLAQPRSAGGGAGGRHRL